MFGFNTVLGMNDKGVFTAHSNIYDKDEIINFNSSKIIEGEVIDYFRNKLHLRCLTRF